MTLQPVVDAHECRLRSAILPCQFNNPIIRNAGDLRRAQRWIFFHAPAQQVGAKSVAREIVVILQSFGEDHVHHRQRQRRVGARPDRDPLVTLIGGARADRVDRDHLCAVGFGL